MERIRNNDPEPEWEPVPHVSEERRSKRACAGWKRMTLKIGFIRTVRGPFDQLLEYWEWLNSQQDQAEGLAPRAPHNRNRAPRHDEYFHVGNPCPPTSKVYPTRRDQCPHVTPGPAEDIPGQSLLQATGGRSGDRAFFMWTCMGCGQRWQRTQGVPGEEPPPRTEGALKPLRAEWPPRGAPPSPPWRPAMQGGAGGPAPQVHRLDQGDTDGDWAMGLLNPTTLEEIPGPSESLTPPSHP